MNRLNGFINMLKGANPSTTSAPNNATNVGSSSAPTPDTTPYTPIEDDIRKDLCIMISLLQQVLELIETEPDPKVLKEQSLRLIDYIDRCCDLYKITFKKRISGYD